MGTQGEEGRKDGHGDTGRRGGGNGHENTGGGGEEGMVMRTQREEGRRGWP